MPRNKPSSFNLWRFAAGAAPAAIAAILVLCHALRPLVPQEQQGILLTIAESLVLISLAVWVWCVVQGVAGKFSERDQAADERQQRIQQQIADNHAEAMRETRHLCRAVQAAHKRLDASVRRLGDAETQRTEITTEIEHLRKLILQQNNLGTLGQERLGPRPLH